MQNCSTNHLKKLYHSAAKSMAKSNRVINLRSDTFTVPCDEMREAIFNAEVGDDVWKEDPTVIELENKMAEITGKEAGLFVASGTMGNLLSILAHCDKRGCEILLGDKSHVFNFEQAGIVQFGNIQPNTVANKPDGTMDLSEVVQKIRDVDIHSPTTELICIENTHCYLGGKVLPLSWIDEISSIAEMYGLPLHMDGARIFNASVASGVSVERILQDVDTASICLSKGLGAPIGSVVVGSKSWIEKVRRLRKAIGGGWRQVGLLAAAGLYTLENNVKKLKNDHENAKIIAQGIYDLNDKNFTVDLKSVQSNMVLLKFNPKIISVGDFVDRLKMVENEDDTSVLGLPWDSETIRMVTYLNISRDDAFAVLEKIKRVIAQLDLK